MAALNYGRLVKLFEQTQEAPRLIREAFEAKELKPREFDLGKLFCECFGYARFAEGRSGALATQLMEAAGAVSTLAFQNISGQIVYNAILDAYQSEDFVFTRLIPEVQTNLSGEKIPGITEIGDEALVVPEGEPFPVAGVSENWIQTPDTLKRGLVVPVTREAVFFDRTGLLLQRCSDVGKWLGVNVEKRAIDCVIDENTTAHRYNWRGNVIASYGDNASTHTWDNLLASNALVDWTDIDGAEQQLNNLTDPFTGEPIVMDAKHLIVTKQLEATAYRILNATTIRVITPGFATSANPNQAEVDNPWRSKYQLVTSRLLAARLATDTSWFLGDVTKYAKRMVNWPLQTKQAPANSHDEFTRDIVQQYRVDERSAFAVVEPRAINKSTA